MATNRRAKINDLNARARKYNAVGVLTLRDTDSILAYYPQCLQCGSTENLTIDHVIPLELQGLNNINNLQTLCESDNKAKGATVADYRPKDKPILERVVAVDPDRDWIAIQQEYETGYMDSRDLAEKHEIPYPTLRDRMRRENWADNREDYRSNLVAKTRDIAEQKELGARLMIGEGAAIAFTAFKLLPAKEQGRIFPDLVKQWAALTGETTERSAIVDGREDLGAFTEEDRKVIEQLAERVAADELGRVPVVDREKPPD